MEIELGRGILLFVYGTMMSRGRNHGRLYEHRAIRIGNRYLTENLFWMYLRSNNGAPCAVPANPHGFPVEGELYAVPAEAIAAMDAAEGSPYIYQRKPVLLREFRGMPVEMYDYVKPLSLEQEDKVPVMPHPDHVLRYEP